MTRYRTRSVEVEAVQFIPHEWEKTRDFLGIPMGGRMNADAYMVCDRNSERPMSVTCLNVFGYFHTATPTDWIIRAADGTLAVMTDGEFKAKYEVAPAPKDDNPGRIS